MITETMQEIKHRMLVFEANRWVGVKEKGGENKGQIVEMFQRAVDGQAQGEPWCLSFQQFCISMVDELYNHVFLSSNPRTDLIKTKHCMTLWNSTKDTGYRTENPFPGCLVIWQFWKDEKPTPQGHVGLVIDRPSDDMILTIEGNTSDMTGGVVREGETVAVRSRTIKGTSTMRVVGFLKVWQ